MIHVSGVGILGAFVCRELAKRGVPFTWGDIDAHYSAWRVCTGAIIPYDDGEESWYAQGYRFWRDTAAAELADFLEPVRLVYALKGSPARQRAKRPTPLAEAPCGVKLWPEPQTGWQLRAQEFVQAIRTAYTSTRRGEQEPAGTTVTIRCHGVLDPYSRPIPIWGWTQLARLRPKPRCPFWPAIGPRVSLHFNNPEQTGARYYFQPQAGTDLWWAGSDRVLQKEPKELDWENRRATFLKCVEQVWSRWLDVEYVSPVLQGWRPEERKSWKLGPVGQWVTPHILVVRPHARNGSQCGPLVAHRLVNLALSSKRPVSA